MSIVIFGDLFSFPEGQAATNRIYTYSKGFIENGIHVHVICFSNIYLDEPNGVIDGISYYNPFEQKERSKYFIVRRWRELVKFKRTYSILKKINREDKIIAINRWSDALITQFFAWVLALFFRTKVITECNEHPLRFYQKGWWQQKTGVIRFYLDSWFSHGILCISRYLIEFHKQRRINQKKLFIVPSTVDPSRFIRTGPRPVPERYIGYFGSLTFLRDNLDLLIRSFAQICNKHSSVSLVLGGFCREDAKKEMLDLIKELKIETRVKILDYLSRKEIANYISHADILVMVRAKDLESDASYPSKLTEFLATGNPVISVNVGEIAEFLKDGINSFLVQPGDVQALAGKLDYVINNYEIAREAGEKGKELTDNVFNYNYQAKRIEGFINLLNNRNSIQ